MAAARAGGWAGARTLLVERGPIGGDCTFTGCVPSKTLIEAAARGDSFAEAMAAVRRAVTIAATEGDDVFRREGVEVLHARATFRSPTELDVDGSVLQMGRIAAANALARRPRQTFDPAAMPWATFTSPEVGRVGLTEAEAAERGGRVAYLPMTEVDRAVAAGQTRGFVKLIAGPRRPLGNFGGGHLLGATVVASRGGELIHEPALAMRTGMFTGRLVQTVHAYPSWSMAIRQAATQFFTEIGGRTARPAEGVRSRTMPRPTAPSPTSPGLSPVPSGSPPWSSPRAAEPAARKRLVVKEEPGPAAGRRRLTHAEDPHPTPRCRRSVPLRPAAGRLRW